MLPPALPAAAVLSRSPGELAHRLIVTNYHEFLPRQLSGNKRTPFDGKLGADGNKVVASRRRKSGHAPRARPASSPAGACWSSTTKPTTATCRAPKARTLNSTTPKPRTNALPSGSPACAPSPGASSCARSMTCRPRPTTCPVPAIRPIRYFPWIVSDFGLIEAIEAGLVKIPFLPVDDSSHAIDEPILKNLYEHCRDELPSKGPAHPGSEAAAARPMPKPRQPKNQGELLPNLPQVPSAPRSTSSTPTTRIRARPAARGRDAGRPAHAPPVFIVVCNNTTVSREVFKDIAGYETVDEHGQPRTVPGRLPLFSNFDPQFPVDRSNARPRC
jgi:type III restriction enzyme